MNRARFWRGEPTGLPRAADGLRRLPRSGPPPRFRDYDDYAEVVGQLEKTGIADYTHIWWDVRPHPRFDDDRGAVMDAITRVEETVSITAYVQGSSSTTPSSTTRARRCPATTASS